MRFSLALIAAVAAVTSVAAQDVAGIVSQIPSCAVTCIATAAAANQCSITDYKCQCGKMSAITASATPCVTSKCQADDAIKVLSLTQQLCKAVGGSSSSASSSAAAGGADSGKATTQAAGGGGAAATPTTNASFATSTNANTAENSFPATTAGSEPTGAFTQNPSPTQTGAASRMGGSGAAAAVVAVAAMLL